MRDKIIKYLEERIEVHSRGCDSWSDSGDRGACYYNEVRPLQEMVTYLKDNKTKKEDPEWVEKRKTFIQELRMEKIKLSSSYYNKVKMTNGNYRNRREESKIASITNKIAKLEAGLK